MLKYIASRVLAFIPTLIIISLMAFIISVNAPGDPVEQLLRSADSEGGTSENASATSDARDKLRKELGLDRPIFYLSALTWAHPDTLYRVADRTEKSTLNNLVLEYGNWDKVAIYHKALLNARLAHNSIDVDKIVEDSREMVVKDRVDSMGRAYVDTVNVAKYGKNEVQERKNSSNISFVSLLQNHEDEVITAKFDSLEALYGRTAYLDAAQAAFSDVRVAYEDMKGSATKWKTYMPRLRWNGSFNQYHLWLLGDGASRRGFVRGDFGKSFKDGQPISEKIGERVKWSLLLAALGIGIAYLVSVPIGIYAAYRRNGVFDNISSIILFILYSMPVFFVATFLLYQFANPDTLVWFPESGIMDPNTYDPDGSFWHKLNHRAPFFVLPLIAYTYGSFAFLSRIMRVGMIEVFSQDYIRTARAKGLKESTVVLKHALRNSLIPIITVFASIFPVAIGGSIIIEMIFSYPGMGVMIYSAVIDQDYPVIVTVFTILGFLTMVGYLVSDILYGVVDPRISYK